MTAVALGRLPVGVALVDAACVVLMGNGNFAMAVGIDPERLVGLDLKALGWEAPRSGVDALSLEEQPLEQLTAGAQVDGLFVLTGQDGRRRDVRVRAVPAAEGSPAVMTMADVTDSLHHVQSQAANSDIYRMVAEHLADVVVVTEQEVIVWASLSSEKVLGYRSADLLGRQIATLVHPEDRVDLNVSPAAPTMFTRSRALAADGTYHWMDGRITGQFGPDGKVERVLHVVRDVHHQHVAEEKAREALLRKRAALDASPDGFAIYRAERDAVGRVTRLVLDFLNASGTASLRRPAADLQGACILDFYPAAASNGLWSDMITTLTTGEQRARRLRDLVGGEWVVADVVTGRLDDDMVVVTYRDVTEQARRQEDLEQAHHDLARSRDTLRSALDAMPDGFSICDAVRGPANELMDLEVVMCNRMAAELSGLAPEATVGLRVRAVLQGGYEHVWDQLVACMNEHRPRRVRYERGVFGAPDWGVHELLATPVGDDRLTMAVRDVSEDERARRAVEELHRQAEHQATHDPLTALPNRSLFLDRLAGALRECRAGERVGVLYVDLDGFKQINDTQGHAAGDDVLLATAERLVATTRPYDTAARLGGDEFAVILRHLPAALDASPLLDRARRRLCQPVTGLDRAVDVSASVGIYLADPARVETDQDPAHVLHRADQAMYEVKRERRGRPGIADPPADDVATESTALRTAAEPEPADHEPSAAEKASLQSGHHAPDTDLGAFCRPADLARCRALAHHARPQRDFTQRPVCRRTEPLTQQTISTLLGSIDKLAERVRTWSPEAWRLLAQAPGETSEVVAARRTAQECAHYAGRDALMAYAHSVVESIASHAIADNQERQAALSLVHDALLAALAADLIDEDTTDALRRGLRFLST